jgi:hypothetical protein
MEAHDVTNSRKRTFLASTALAAAMMFLAGSDPGAASAQGNGRVFWGTWVITLDTGVFGFPGGTFRGLATVHRDGTLMLTDGGDLASFPFSTSDTTQQGVWVQTGPQTLRSTTLFLRKDEASGEIEGWHRVRITAQFGSDGDHMMGFAYEEVLACDPSGPTPVKLLNCPDPTTSDFEPAPFAIPITLTRLEVE